MSALAILQLIWGAIKAFFGALLAFCSKPPGSWIALVCGILLAFWLWGNHRYNAGVTAQTAADAGAISTLTGNVGRLTGGLRVCNASIEAARAAGVRQGAADAKQAGVEAAQREAGRLLAIKPGANALVTAYQVGTTGRAK
jgi:hypothetical protein